MSRRILVQLVHPVLERSRVNRRLVEAVRDLPFVTVNDLYEAYPTLDVDVRREQALLLEHDVVVFQHPLYWYSGPPLLKQWQDLVLAHGWAYGRGGVALKDKVTFHAVSCGGPKEAYAPGGSNRFTLRELMRPFEQTAFLCGMQYLAPLALHRALSVTSDADLAPHAAVYRRVLQGLHDESLDLTSGAAALDLSEALATQEAR